MWIRSLSERAVALALLATCVVGAAPAPSGSADPMADYRRRFKLGWERWEAGNAADAIAYWEPLYREMGEVTGYRLAYNLGVAYMAFQDATRAAERLQAFLDQVDARKGRGETLEKAVADEAADARERMATLQSTKGRIEVGRGATPISAAVDADQPRLAGFIAWVTPGEHTVTFDPGAADAEQRRVTVQAGQLVEVNPAPPPAASASAPAASAGDDAGAGAGASTGAPPAFSASTPQPMVTHEVTHPFAPALLYVTGGLGVAAGIAAVALNRAGWSDVNNFNPSSPNAANDRSNYSGLRTLYYADTAVAVGLGVATAALVTWYFLGTKERDIIVTPAGVSGRF